MNKQVSNIGWARTLVSLFFKKGIHHVCISPGSRNTPLTYAFLEHPNIKSFCHIDERSNCFFGLGISKKIQKPVVILTTSGTATANLFPGIIEAKLSMTPLIILTADRPRRLVNTGETQTIDQINLYGQHVQSTLDIDHSTSTPSTLLKKINKLLEGCLIPQKNSGPIHFNIRFDEPLLDFKDKALSLPKKNTCSAVKSDKLELPKFKRPLIICGPTNQNFDIKSILKLSKKINAPIFADILSQMRHLSSMMVYYEHYLKKIKKPDLIIRFGNKPTSKKLNAFLGNFEDRTFLINTYGRYNDDCKNISMIDYKDLSKNILTNFVGEKKWFKYIQNLEASLKMIMNKNIDIKNSQAKTIRTIIPHLKKNDSMFIGNSTIIRTLDQFSGKFSSSINIHGNYITRGIDGITSTALGMAYACKKNNLLITGDISFFYDSNAFHILENTNINLTIVVINNNGGQIFSRLPYSNEKIKDFETFWITPLSRKIKDLANLFKLKYYLLKTDQIDKKMKNILNKNGVKIIEININNEVDIKFNEDIDKKILKELS